MRSSRAAGRTEGDAGRFEQYTSLTARGHDAEAVFRPLVVRELPLVVGPAALAERPFPETTRPEMQGDMPHLLPSLSSRNVISGWSIDRRVCFAGTWGASLAVDRRLSPRGHLANPVQGRSGLRLGQEIDCCSRGVAAKLDQALAICLPQPPALWPFHWR